MDRKQPDVVRGYAIPRATGTEQRLKTLTNEYIIKDQVGEGTFSFVYRAVREGDKETVAIKRSKDSVPLFRLLQEAECLKTLSGCANVVQFLDCEYYENGTLDIVMPYFCPSDFAVDLNEGKYDTCHTLSYMHGLFSALAHIHQHRCAPHPACTRCCCCMLCMCMHACSCVMCMCML